MTSERVLAAAARAWPFLPHIGTFGEVARTTQVRQAFQRLSDIPTRLFCYSDDMDGLRKVPDNIPNQELVAQHLGKPLTAIPDPFGTHDSYGAHNNARLQAFLDDFGFDYEFQSSTQWYNSGRFDEALLKVLEHYEAIMAIMLPTLGAERRQTYSPFLPICQETGRVLQVPVVERNVEAGTIVYRDEDDSLVETPVTGGRCKLQWKPDWAMRWYALDVDYEMSGKDLIDSVNAGKVLGGRPPAGFTYELFLDENGEKISKSRGNGLTVEEWLSYAPQDSLALFMYQKPRAAKRLYFDVIPRTVDDYLSFLARFEGEDDAKRLENPVWHIHNGAPPKPDSQLGFAMLLNLASVCNTEDPTVLWGFISRYAPDASPAKAPILDRLVGCAIRYYRDFVKPNKRYRAPSETERAALADLLDALEALPGDADGEAIQTQVYEVGKRHDFAELRAWFKALYEILLGQEQGPRMGSFMSLYGIEDSRVLLRRALAGEDLAAEAGEAAE
jgi:lysyl-tRNA synthetase class 1